jgi:hypothetical protein
MALRGWSEKKRSLALPDWLCRVDLPAVGTLDHHG